MLSSVFYCFLWLFVALYYIVYMVRDDMICVKCKKSIPDGSSYCNHCGARQERAAPKHKRGNGTGNAYRRGNTWTARWTEKIYLGDDDRMVQQMRTKGGFKTKTAALAYAASVHEDVKPAPTLRDYWKQYTRSFYLDLSHDKQTAYDIAWGKLSSVADYSIGELTTAQLQDVIDSKTPTYYPAKGVGRETGARVRFPPSPPESTVKPLKQRFCGTFLLHLYYYISTFKY